MYFLNLYRVVPNNIFFFKFKHNTLTSCMEQTNKKQINEVYQAHLFKYFCLWSKAPFKKKFVIQFCIKVSHISN